MQADALLFDFGGTLDTDGVHWCEKYWDLYQELKIAVPREAFDRAFVEADRRLADDPPRPGEGFFRIIQQQVRFQFEYLAMNTPGFAGGAIDRDDLVGLAYRRTSETIGHARPLLAELARGRKMAVVSNFNGNLEQVLDEFDLRRSFQVIIDSTVVGVAKPDPEIFRMAVRQIGVPADRCAVIGDSYDRDIVPGKAAGCRTIWVKGRSWREWNETSKADAIVSCIHEIPSRLT
jgi:HAD superfamily hydrolase (TIGR01509 family)